MAATVDISVTGLAKREFERLQALMAAINLVMLSDLKQMTDLAQTNRKVEEIKSYNDILFAAEFIEEIIKKLNLDFSKLLKHRENLNAFQEEERRKLEQMLRKAIQNDDFFNQLQNEKDRILRNQMLLTKINEVDLTLSTMIDASHLRIGLLNSEILENNNQTKSAISDILNSSGYNREPRDFNISGRTIHFEANEITEKLDTKLAEKIDQGILTRDNLIEETKKSFHEVIEERVKESGLDNDISSDDIAAIADEEFTGLENNLRESEHLENLYAKLDIGEDLNNKLESETLLINTLQHLRNNLPMDINEMNFENAKNVLQNSLAAINLIELTNFSLVDLEEEEFSFDDDDIAAEQNKQFENFQQPNNNIQQNDDKKSDNAPHFPGDPSENLVRAEESPSAPNNNDIDEKAKIKSSTAKLQAIFGKPIAPAAEKDSEVKNASAAENKSQPSSKQPVPSNPEPSSEEKKQEEEYKPRGPGFR